MRQSISRSGGAENAKPSFLESFLKALISQKLIDRNQLSYAIRVKDRLEHPKPLLVVLQELKYVTKEQLLQAYRKQPIQVRLGQFLIEFGYITEAELNSALSHQKGGAGRNKRLGEILIERNLISEAKLVEALTHLLGYLTVDLNAADIDYTLLSKSVFRAAAKYCFIPVEVRESKVVVAFGDPLDETAIETARNVLGAEIIPAVSRRSQVNKKLNEYDRTTARDDESISEQTVTGLVNAIFEEAVHQQASDIHIEPLEDKIRVRFRIDGVLVHHRDLPKQVRAALTSRIKVLAEADIVEKRRHQDGRVEFRLATTNQAIDMRVSFYSTINGESIVLRLLNRKTELLDIHEIGMAPLILERFIQDVLDVPTGVVIVTGPTGSGKTTTLYSSVDYLNDPQVSIISAEDPVEYVIDGVSQCSINPKINLTYEESLRHIVRQDPDVIVLGEIRDKFSAETAIQAALTGHKVLTTFHTEDSIGGLLRLLNMDIEAFLISSTVVSVVAQRLVRKVCTHCAEPFTPDHTLLRRLGIVASDYAGASFMMGHGCEHCRHTGYSGRVCVFEMLNLNERVKDAVLQKKPSYEIRRISMETAGLVSLLEDGLVKAAAGITSLQEVLKYLPRPEKPRPLHELQRLLGSHSII